MFMMWKNYGIKFVRLHTGNFLSRFCCILMDMKCDVLLAGRNINSNVVLKKYLLSENDEASGKFRMLCNKELCDLWKSPVVEG